MHYHHMQTPILGPFSIFISFALLSNSACLCVYLCAHAYLHIVIVCRQRNFKAVTTPLSTLSRIDLDLIRIACAIRFIYIVTSNSNSSKRWHHWIGRMPTHKNRLCISMLRARIIAESLTYTLHGLVQH